MTNDLTMWERLGVRITPTSLSLAGPDISYGQAEEILTVLGALDDSVDWWIGDALNEIEMTHGDKVYQAATVLKRSERTMINRMSVCRRVPRSRRREGLSFSHHDAVAKFEPDEQNYWLERAEQEGWTRDDLRERTKPSSYVNGAEVLPPPVVSEVCQCCGRPT